MMKIGKSQAFNAKLYNHKTGFKNREASTEIGRVGSPDTVLVTISKNYIITFTLHARHLMVIHRLITR